MNDLAARYHFADFTHAAYRDLVVAAQKKYPFAGYGDYAGRECFVLWRHDVDMSMHAALALARIEAEAGVKATYFLLPGSAFYNLLEPEIQGIIRQIRALGHEFALHFDAAKYAVTDAGALTRWIAHEKRLLEDYCAVPLTAFSFHNPDAQSAGFRDLAYAGLVNAYADPFQGAIAYCSDSNGIWRHRRLADVLHEAPAQLQVLTHPEWWVDAPMAPRRRVWRALEGRAAAGLAVYNRLLRDYGRENVTELSDIFALLDEMLGVEALPIQMAWLRHDMVAAVRRLAQICADRLGADDARLGRFMPLLAQEATAADLQFLSALLKETAS